MVGPRFLLTLSLLLYLNPLTVLATDNLIQNPGFEQSSGSSFASWSKTPSTLSLSTASISGLFHSGAFSASFKSQSTSTKYLYQVITNPLGTLKLSAWIRLLNDNQSGFVRLSWYESADGSGTEIKSLDSPVVASISDWQKIEVSGDTPSPAKSLRVKLVLDPSTSNTVELLFDEVVLEQVDPPPMLSFSISLPSSIETGEEFTIAVDLKGLAADSAYFLKVLGDSKDKLPGELYNFYTWSSVKNTFLAWNASWSDYPVLITDQFGSSSVTVKGKFKSDSFIGENKIVIRLRKEGSSTNIDSDSAPISLSQSETKLAETDDGKKEPAVPGPFTSSISKTTVTFLEKDQFDSLEEVEQQATDEGVVLGSHISTIPPLSLATNSETPETPILSEESNFPWEIPLLGIGGVFLGSAILTMVIKAGGWNFIKGIFVSE